MYTPATEYGREWIKNRLQKNYNLIKDIFEEIIIEENIKF